MSCLFFRYVSIVISFRYVSIIIRYDSACWYVVINCATLFNRAVQYDLNLKTVNLKISDLDHTANIQIRIRFPYNQITFFRFRSSDGTRPIMFITWGALPFLRGENFIFEANPWHNLKHFIESDRKFSDYQISNRIFSDSIWNQNRLIWAVSSPKSPPPSFKFLIYFFRIFQRGSMLRRPVVHRKHLPLLQYHHHHLWTFRYVQSKLFVLRFWMQ